MHSPRIRLAAIEGPLTGQESVVEGLSLCVIGRAPDCAVQLPSSQDLLDISRHHCILDIEPSSVRVRDLGSLNGTYLNGVKIGQRPGSSAPLAAFDHLSLSYELHDGDRIQVGRNVFRIEIEAPSAGPESHCYSTLA